MLCGSDGIGMAEYRASPASAGIARPMRMHPNIERMVARLSMLARHATPGHDIGNADITIERLVYECRRNLK